MKISRIAFSLFALILLVLFICNPTVITSGVVSGLLVCSNVIIPSLFPFTAVLIFIFKCQIFNFLGQYLNPITKLLFGQSGECFCVMLMSFLGGFPVGARLIDELASENAVSQKTAARMLSYSVNPGPAFVIIGIGQTLLGSTTIGIILYSSNILSSLIICFALSFKERKEDSRFTAKRQNNTNISDIFVNSVYDASISTISICGYVILFSAIIKIISNIFESSVGLNILLSLLEISNGTVIFSKNILMLSFLIGFAGFSVHLQIISICKHIKFNYKSFFISRTLCGILSSYITFLLIKVFKITVPVISLNSDMLSRLNIVSLPLTFALVLMTLTLLISIKQKNVEKITNI